VIVGFGENSVDHVYRLPRYPTPGANSKMAIDRHDVHPGGQVATTLATCAGLGLATRYVGAFGNDDNGSLIRRALEERGVDTQSAMVRPAGNRHAVILLDTTHGERVVLWQRDARLAIAAADVRATWLEGATLLHVDASDEDAAIALAGLARERGLPVTCDIDRVTPATTALLDRVTIPILAEHVPLALTGETDPERALRRLRATHPGPLVTTLGARGSVMLDGERYIHAPGFDVTVVDSTGAGDVFRGAFIHALLRGDAKEDVLRFANAAAAVSCTREGALDSSPTLENIERLMAVR
jgi:sugar/nucleoside kinase (ribokinase family)